MKAKDIKYVFQENPELKDVGTKTQYYKYLNTVFPDSKINDIVYHGSKREGVDTFDTVSNWTPKGNSRFKVKQEVSKGLYLTKDRAFIDEFKKNNTVNKTYSMLVNAKSPQLKSGIVNSNDIEIEKVKELQKNYDSIISDEGGVENTVIAFEPAQVHILGSKKDKEGFGKFVSQSQGPSLESKLISGFFIFSILVGLVFSLPNITGNVIGIQKSTFNFAWPALSLVGLFGLYVCRRHKQ